MHIQFRVWYDEHIITDKTFECNATVASNLFQTSFYEDHHLNFANLSFVSMYNFPYFTTNFTAFTKPK